MDTVDESGSPHRQVNPKEALTPVSAALLFGSLCCLSTSALVVATCTILPEQVSHIVPTAILWGVCGLWIGGINERGRVPKKAWSTAIAMSLLGMLLGFLLDLTSRNLAWHWSLKAIVLGAGNGFVCGMIVYLARRANKSPL
jgi:hypothetical protein